MNTAFQVIARFALVAILPTLTGCDRLDSSQPASLTPKTPTVATEKTTPTPTNAAKVVYYSYQVVQTWPHDRKAFTQGLLVHGGFLFESTGLKGQSTLRKVQLNSGVVLKQISIPSEYFAEGLAVLSNKLFQLTWQERKGFVYDLDSFVLEREFTYEGEGWGLTADYQSLIMSDGTDRIRFMDPKDFKVSRAIDVRHSGQPINRLNELEYVHGEIFANVWGTDYVVRIDPTTGKVVGVINFANLLSPEDRTGTDVLNGIAYDATGDRLFVTGKWWPKLFEVRLNARE